MLLALTIVGARSADRATRRKLASWSRAVSPRAGGARAIGSIARGSCPGAMPRAHGAALMPDRPEEEIYVLRCRWLHGEREVLELLAGYQHIHDVDYADVVLYRSLIVACWTRRGSAMCAAAEALPALTCGVQDDESTQRRLGALLNESHESCRAEYDCSCPELDALVLAFRSLPSGRAVGF